MKAAFTAGRVILYVVATLLLCMLFLQRGNKTSGAVVQAEIVRSDGDIQSARNRIAAEDSARWLEANAPTAEYFQRREDLLHKSVGMASLKGLYCEFGVAEGYSINLIAGWTKSEVHGFDSFEGSPQDWWQNGFMIPKGTWAQKALPKVAPNVRLHKGWFNVTAPKFHQEHVGEPIAFIHFDADLYASDKAVFDAMAEHFVPKTIIQFDEFLNYPGWKANDFRAFTEFAAAHELKYQPIGYSRYQFALQVESIEH